MRAIFVHWVLVLLMLFIGLPVERVAESPVRHTAEEDSSSERQDESLKHAASRKRNPRLATPWNPNLQQLHQVFRI
jgi:hypothetical protein